MLTSTGSNKFRGEDADVPSLADREGRVAPEKGGLPLHGAVIRQIDPSQMAC